MYNLNDVDDLILEWVEDDGRSYEEFEGDAEILVQTLLLDIQNQIAYITVCEMIRALGDIEMTDPIAMYALMKGRELFEEKYGVPLITKLNMDKIYLNQASVNSMCNDG